MTINKVLFSDSVMMLPTFYLASSVKGGRETKESKKESETLNEKKELF